MPTRITENKSTDDTKCSWGHGNAETHGVKYTAIFGKPVIPLKFKHVPVLWPEHSHA